MELRELRDAFCCRRQLSIAPRAANRALLCTRTDSGFHHRFTLGEHGSFEIDGDMIEVTNERRSHQDVLHIPGRLWDPSGSTMMRIDVTIHAESRQRVEVSLFPAQRLPEWFHGHDLEHWTDLAGAALDELCEEILWQAGRDGNPNAQDDRG